MKEYDRFLSKSEYLVHGRNMKNMARLLVCLALLFLPIVVQAEQDENPTGYSTDSLAITLSPSKVAQGSVCVVAVRSGKSLISVEGRFVGRAINFFPNNGDTVFQAIIGIDLEFQPGSYDLIITAKDESNKPTKRRLPLLVVKREFGVEHLTLPPRMVFLDKETLKRVKKEKQKINSIWATETSERFWDGVFIMPVHGKVLGRFGVSRIINGEKKSPHSGVDLKASLGTPVKACNNGRVVLVDDLFFAGKSVILDHGQGLYSMYFHLSKELIKCGEVVAKGSNVGLVGSTGRCTGPHLHWGIRLDNARVDPISFVEQTKSLQ